MEWRHRSSGCGWRTRWLARLLAVSLVATVLLVAPARSAAAAPGDSYLLLLDVSGSMGQPAAGVGGQSRLDVATSSISSAVAAQQSSALNVGLRTFSGCGAGTSSLLVPVSPLDPGSISAAAGATTAGGSTDIETALRSGVADFSGGARTIVLLSDGVDTCGGDPCGAAKSVIASGVDLVVNTIGFQTNSAANAQLRCIADATGGTHRSASDPDSLLDSIEASIDQPAASVVEQATPICINDEKVLNDPLLQDSALGQRYFDSGVLYVLISGDACGFDCVSGFDVNCDGELGDYCPSETPRTTVSGVKECLRVVDGREDERAGSDRLDAEQARLDILQTASRFLTNSTAMKRDLPKTLAALTTWFHELDAQSTPGEVAAFERFFAAARLALLQQIMVETAAGHGYEQFLKAGEAGAQFTQAGVNLGSGNETGDLAVPGTLSSIDGWFLELIYEQGANFVQAKLINGPGAGLVEFGEVMAVNSYLADVDQLLVTMESEFRSNTWIGFNDPWEVMKIGLETYRLKVAQAIQHAEFAEAFTYLTGDGSFWDTNLRALLGAAGDLLTARKMSKVLDGLELVGAGAQAKFHWESSQQALGLSASGLEHLVLMVEGVS